MFETQEGKKTLAELFEGRSQLLAYNVMYGPDYSVGACPGCTSLADELDGARVHLGHKDVTLICFSRADRSAHRIQGADGLGFPPTCRPTRPTSPWDFGLALTEEQAKTIPEIQEMLKDPPDWLQEWSEMVGADLKDGLREGAELDRIRPRQRNRVPHVHGDGARPVRGPVPRVLAGSDAEGTTGPFRIWRKDEYPD